MDLPDAKYLDLILYSREQINKETEALPYSDPDASADASDKELQEVPWGLISIKAQDEDHETPMQPITMLRNALGKDEGGSGVPLDRTKYEESVAYWQDHAVVQ